MLLVLKNKLTIGTNFAIGETRFRLPLHLLRFTVHSSTGTAQRRARARTHDHSEAGFSRAGLLAVDIAASRRRTSNDTPSVSVEPRRFELLTFSLQRRRSTS
jgi:hypothetical protein